MGVVLALVAAAPVAAQEPGPGVCEDGTVAHIFIDNHSIFDTSDPALNPRFRWAYSLANRLHVRTKKEFINRELLLDRGDCFDPVLLEESARLLRAYDFIARADVYGVPQEDGSHHVVVDTEDEWTTQIEVQFDASGGLEFEQLEVREENILGTGQAATFFYHSMDATRAYGLGYETPQLFRTRWDLGLEAGKTRAGGPCGSGTASGTGSSTTSCRRTPPSARPAARAAASWSRWPRRGSTWRGCGASGAGAT